MDETDDRERRRLTGDSTLRFLRDGYLFGTRGFERVGADWFSTRFIGRPVTVARGAEAARFFYEDGRFDRTKAMPNSVKHLLQDEGSVQTLEGEQHHHRKRLFLDLAAESERRAALVAVFENEWMTAVRENAGKPIRMQEFSATVLGRAALRWAGAPVDERVISELRAMVDNAGRFGPANWMARLRRRHAEAWVGQHLSVSPEGSPLRGIVDYRGEARQLPLDVAAVEALNLLRPIVAVGRFITFAALALHRRPEWRTRIRDEEPAAEWFANEVRRFYPFFPVVGGRATRDLEWQGQPLQARSWFLLDLYATDRDPAAWPAPGQFQPERHQAPVDRNAFIAQGGGHYETDHRCPGEPATVDLLTAATRTLATGPRFQLDAAQDLRVSLRRIPAGPEDGLRGQFSPGS